MPSTWFVANATHPIARVAAAMSLVALCAGLLWVRPASAARPLATDDAGVLSRGDCEAEGYGSRLNLPGVGRESTASMQLSCGLGSDAQIAAGYGHSTRSDDQNGNRHEALATAGKLRVVGGDDAPASFALSAGSVMGRTGSGRFQFDSIYATGVLSGELTERITGHVNVGSSHSRATHVNSTTWNLAIELALQKGLDVGAEWYGDDRSPAWLGFGVRYAATETLTFGASVAVQSDSLRQRLVSLGVTLGF